MLYKTDPGVFITKKTKTKKAQNSYLSFWLLTTNTFQHIGTQKLYTNTRTHTHTQRESEICMLVAFHKYAVSLCTVTKNHYVFI